MFTYPEIITELVNEVVVEPPKAYQDMLVLLSEQLDARRFSSLLEYLAAGKQLGLIDQKQFDDAMNEAHQYFSGIY